MSEDHLKISREHPGITILTLNRPEVRNALSIALMQDLIGAIEETHAMREQRVLIFRGEGLSFCTGLDLKEAADLVKSEESAKTIAELLKVIYSSPLFTISVIHGVTIAGGAGIAAVSDYVIAEENLKFGFPEVSRGLVPGIVMTFISRHIHERDAKDLFLLGQTVTASRAKEMGLVNRIASQQRLIKEAVEVGKQSMDGGPATLTQIKRLLMKLYSPHLDEEISQALILHRLSRGRSEAKEGIQAFLEKRKAKWCLGGEVCEI